MAGPGHGYSKVAFSNAIGEHNFTAAGDVEPIADDGRFAEAAVNVYVEQGLREHLDLIVSATFKRAEFRNTAGTDATTVGLSDLFAGVRFGALEPCPIRVSGLTQLKIPMAYDESQSPPLGAGQVDLDARLLVSASLHPFPGYLTGELGFRWRRDFANEVPYMFEGGIDLGGGTWVRLTAIGVDSRGETADDVELALVNREEDYLKLGPGLALPLDDWLSIELAYWRVVAGKSTIESNEFSLGVSFRN